MTDKQLLNQVARLGLPMFEPETDLDVNETLARVVKSREARLWEGFPVLLANAAVEYGFSLARVREKLTSEQALDLQQLMLLSFALYRGEDLSFPWATRLIKDLVHEDKALLKKWRYQLDNDEKIIWEDFEFDPQRLKNTFNSYIEQIGENTRRRREKHDEYSLEHAMSQLFSPKQKELFKRKLDGLPMTKTENEYYSRVVKKKVVALANSRLHSLARKLLVM